MVSPNPFSPTFGVTPPVLAGRDDELAAFADALDGGPGAPGRASLYVGNRGVGKTVLLNAVEDLARSRGWEVVSETAASGLVGRLVDEHLPLVLRRLDPDARRRGITGGSVSAFGVGASVTTETEDPYRYQAGLRTQLSAAAELAETGGAGVVISVDEVHGARRDELRALTVTVQHAFREGRAVALVLAGLPSGISGLLRDDVVTFLRRADTYHLSSIDAAATETAIADPIADHGRTITPDALAAVVAASGGYPFMIQLLGYHLWRNRPDREVIDGADAEAAVTAARRRLAASVHAVALADLSDTDRAFCVAMAVDEGPSVMADVAGRMGVNAQYAGVYRRRLIDAGIIGPAGHGRVDFAIPYLREHLRADTDTET